MQFDKRSFQECSPRITEGGGVKPIEDIWLWEPNL